jgi:RNA polymerase sigma-B factor
MGKKIILDDGCKEMTLEEVYEHFKSLVWWLVRKEVKDHEIHEDLFQEACVGLVKAYKAYDASRGYKFATLLTCKVIFEIKRAMRDTDPRIGKIIRMPRDRTRFSYKLSYLSEVINDGNNPITLEDAIEDGQDIEEEVVSKLAVEGFIDKQCMPQTHRKVFELMRDNDGDITQKQIGQAIGRSQVMVSRVISRYRQQYLSEVGI